MLRECRIHRSKTESLMDAGRKKLERGAKDHTTHESRREGSEISHNRQNAIILEVYGTLNTRITHKTFCVQLVFSSIGRNFRLHQNPTFAVSMPKVLNKLRRQEQFQTNARDRKYWRIFAKESPTAQPAQSTV